MTPHVLQHGGALVASVVVLSSVIMMRGLSEQWTHALGAMRHRGSSDWWRVVVDAGDVARCAANVRQAQPVRRAARVVASIPAEVNESPSRFRRHGTRRRFRDQPGVSAEQQCAPPRSPRHTVAKTSRCRSSCEMSRNVTPSTAPVGTERWRVGVEFGNALPQAINSLVAFCMVEPARQRLGIRSAHRLTTTTRWSRPSLNR